MAEIVVHKLYEEKERQYIIDAYENFGKKTARKWKEELKKIQNREFNKQVQNYEMFL